jgi:metal-sulfur cluster biosynthetic enzyme
LICCSNQRMESSELPDRVRTALQRVCDPEIGESIVELGLVERIELSDGRLHVVLIPTSATCPMADVLVEDTLAAVQPLLPPEVVAAVRLDFDIPWSPARMSPALQERFGWAEDDHG